MFLHDRPEGKRGTESRKSGSAALNKQAEKICDTSGRMDMHATTRRTAVQGALGVLGLATVTALVPQGAFAQAARAPVGPIEITVGTGAGGTPDVVMRQVAKVLNETGLVKNPIVVQNRTGGSWTVAAKFVIGKPGNENVLLAMAGPIWGTPITQGVDTFYDKVTPIAMWRCSRTARSTPSRS
jgi:tripartite-type tricarboxylate transporter receptor subunit TctC